MGVNKKSVNLKGGENMELMPYQKKIIERLFADENMIYNMYVPRRFGKSHFCKEAVKAIIRKAMEGSTPDRINLMIVTHTVRQKNDLLRQIRDWYCESYPHAPRYEYNDTMRWGFVEHRGVFSLHVETDSFFQELDGAQYYDYIFYDNADLYSLSTRDAVDRHFAHRTGVRKPNLYFLGTNNQGLMRHLNTWKGDPSVITPVPITGDDIAAYKIRMQTTLDFSERFVDAVLRAETIEHPSLKVANKDKKNVLELVV